MDQFTSAERSEVMRRVASKDTTPERVVRSLAHQLGYRFRLHRDDLPGTPDLVFPRLRAVVFVHGCFWHQHSCPRGNRRPATNREYWNAKLERNVRRDRRNIRRLRRTGWRVLVVWECETRRPERVEQRLRRFLERAAAGDEGR
jgi:DNA mismatch endonuclease (patch repair protein)